MARTQRACYPGAVAFGLSALAALIGGCANSQDFISQAEGEGIQVYEAQLARDTVNDLCQSLDDNSNPMNALFALAGKRMNDPPFSTDDGRVLELGVNAQCNEHSEAFAGLRSAFDETDAGLTDPELGPDAELPPEPAAPIELAFGETHAFPSGVELTVTAPRNYTRTEADRAYAFNPGGPDDGAQVAVTISNGSQAAISPSSFVGSATINGQPLNPLAFAPSPEGELRQPGSDLLPGQTQTFDELYWITAPGDLVIAYTDSGGSGTVYYRGSVSGDVVSEQTAVQAPPTSN